MSPTSVQRCITLRFGSQSLKLIQFCESISLISLEIRTNNLPFNVLFFKRLKLYHKPSCFEIINLLREVAELL